MDSGKRVRQETLTEEVSISFVEKSETGTVKKSERLCNETLGLQNPKTHHVKCGTRVRQVTMRMTEGGYVEKIETGSVKKSETGCFKKSQMGSDEKSETCTVERSATGSTEK